MANMLVKKGLFRSLRRRKNEASQEKVLHKRHRVVLQQAGPEQQPEQAPKKSTFVATRSSESNNSNGSGIRSLFKSKKKSLFVKVPIGLDEGNTLMVVSPCETIKFPVKIPKGYTAGQSFPVELPQVPKPDEQEGRQDEEETSFEYMFRVVDHCLTPTPSWEEDKGKENQQPSEKQHQQEEEEEEREDFGTTLDNFFTPVPEVRAFYVEGKTCFAGPKKG